jgi:heme A synthase
MPALAHRHEAAPTPLRRTRPRLSAVGAPRRRRTPSAASLACYALGLVLGFLLAGIASVPGGAGVVSAQLLLAAGAGLVAGLAALRARAVARERRAGATRL